MVISPYVKKFPRKDISAILSAVDFIITIKEQIGIQIKKEHEIDKN